MAENKTQKQKEDEMHEHGRVEPDMPDYSTGPNEFRGTNEADVIREMQEAEGDHKPPVKTLEQEAKDPNINARQLEQAEKVRKQNAARADETDQNFKNTDIDRERPLNPKKKK